MPLSVGVWAPSRVVADQGASLVGDEYNFAGGFERNAGVPHPAEQHMRTGGIVLSQHAGQIHHLHHFTQWTERHAHGRRLLDDRLRVRVEDAGCEFAVGSMASV